VSPERLQQIEAIYIDALALESAERPAFLDGICGNDVDLRREIESLLLFESQAENYLDRPAMQLVAESLAEQGAGVLVDRMLGRYQLLSLVGRGGMAEVYCAVDSRLNRLVAVKVLPKYMAEDPERLHRFEQEAQAIGALNHPNICTLHDAGNDGGLPYLVFEYLVGELLADRLSRGPMTVPEALECATQVAEALAHAHEQGIIHLDLKPRNIMLTRSGVKLLDFGIAELRYPDRPGSMGIPVEKQAPARSRDTPGTVGYMAPEQIEGQATDARTDIFGFGLVVYEMLTGHAAFAGSSSATVPAVSQTQPKIPAALDFLISRCLSKNPSERWQSMSEVRSFLEKSRKSPIRRE